MSKGKRRKEVSWNPFGLAVAASDFVYCLVSVFQFLLCPLMITSAQVVKTSINVVNNNPNLVPRASSSSRHAKLRMAGRGGDSGNEIATTLLTISLTRMIKREKLKRDH